MDGTAVAGPDGQGEDSPTVRDVARHVGVHPSTVSRALNPATRSRVNRETADRIATIARSLGYQPNPIARSLRTRRTLTVGMLLPDLTNPLFPPIVRGVEDALAEHAYAVLLANTDYQDDREARHFEALRTRQVDGLILGTAKLEHPLALRAIGGGLPLVLVNGLVEGLAAPSVVGDNAGGIAAAVSHLVRLGHRDIAFVSGPRTMTPGVTRLWSYRQHLEAHGIKPRPELTAVCDAWSEAEGASALRSLLDGKVRFTAVIASNDLLALGCMDALAERGIDIPGQISLVGFHDMPFTSRLAPPLTTVRVPHYQLGVEAARLLLEVMAGRGTTAKLITLPVELVVRGSTAPPPGR